eukprot:s1919_g10.t1
MRLSTSTSKDHCGSCPEGYVKNTEPCSNGACDKDEDLHCCLATCATYTACTQPGFVLNTAATALVCDERGCDDGRCCLATCATYSTPCPRRHLPLPNEVLRMFSDELFDQMRAAYRPDDMTGAGGLNSDDDDVAGDEGMLAAEEETVTHDGSVDPGPDEDPPVVDVLQPGASRDGSMTSSRRRRRGTRGSGASSGRSLGSQNVAIRKWRSGAIPTAPTFEGDIDANPFCLRHYRRRLMRWVRITKEYLPANEQALRAREQLQGEAEIELEETPDEKYDCEEGISLLLADLEQSFGERELFRQGGVIREFESIGRLQGETVTSFVRRFRLLEGRLKDNKVPSYPEEARVVKLLDGLRLDERSTSALLLAAGNRYNMQAIQEAIRIQYPAGMSVTGIPKPAAVNNKKTKSNYSKWSSLHTTGYEDYDEAEYEALAYEYEPGYDEANEYEHADVEPEGDVEYYYDEEDETAVNEQSGTAAEEASSSQPLADSLIQAVNALTVTSRQLAEITKARGFYQLKNDKGKGLKGKSAGKAKGKGKNFGSSKGFGKYSGGKKGKPVANSAAQGKGKPSATPTRQNLDQQRQRLNTAACLGCGSTSHWIKDCPHNNKYSAQLATVGVTLNAEGIPMSECLMVSTEEEKSYQLPELHENNHFDRTSLPLEHIQQNEFHELDLLPDGSCSIPPTPKVLIQYANQEAFLMIADTGCQRQVAGLAWHLQRQKEIYPLQPLHAKEHCRFSFGPNAGVPSKERLAYPAGLGGAYAMLGISLVESNAPALFSRPAFEKLGAIPNLLQGVMHYVALQTCSRLYLSPCGHLAIRIDEWPSRLFAWPPEIEHSSFEDAWSPDALKLETTVLQQPEVSSCPPPHAASNSAMASQVARFDAPCHGVCVLDPTGSDSLRSCEHASQSQGQGSEGVLSGSDGNHNAADDFGTHAAVHHSDSGLCEQTQPVHSPVGPQILRGRQDQGKDMRFVRIEMRDRERRFDTSTTKSISDRKDSSFRDQDQGQEQGNVKFPLRKLGRGLRLLFPTLLAAGICGPSAPVDKPFVNGVQVASSTLDCWHDGGGSGGPSSSLRGPSLSAGSPQSSGAFGHLSGRGRGRHVLGTTSGSGGELRTHGGGRGGTDGWVNDGVHFSADQPMTVDDVGSGPLKAGTEKRLRGNCRQVHDIWQVEAKIYAQQAQRARVMRSYHYDVVEIFGGMSNITVEALQCGLRALQPVDVVHGVKLDDKKDYKVLTKLLKERRPFLVVWEIRCDPWSKLNHLNYTADELQALQDSHYESLAGMCEAIIELYKDGIHFLIENPWGTAFWTHDEIMRVRALPGARLEKGSMCNFGLRGKEGNLIRKDTGWLSDLAEVLHQIARPCSGNHDHEHCLGGNSKRAQVYTKALARGVVKGLIQTLKSCGDERFLSGDEPCRFQWVCANEKGVLFSNMDFDIDSTCWSCTTLSDNFEVLYLDIDRNEQAWLPLLAEAQTRWEDKVSASAIVRPGTAFFAQIQDLVPWVIHQAQIARSPKVRRIPHQLMSSKPVTHRASILKFQDGKVRLETEEVKSFSSSKFEAPVTFAIFVYGEAPETSLDPSANALPETEALNKPDKEKAPSALQPEEELRAHQPGSRDITFEAEDGKIPKWVQNALRRLHTNLGHPSNESLVRHLAQAGASGVALLGGKALRCSVCSRTRPPHQPRPAKAVRSRRFNDRIFLDIVFLKNINFETFAYLNVLDDATTYQVLDALDSRSEECVVKTLVNGWLRYFGYPDEMVVDAEGALRGILFENLVAQTGIQLRFVPPDAHYQLGKCERHGQAAKWIARRLVSQFAAVTQEEMNIMTSLTTWAKNTMIRRCGASPCQWVYGKQPKIPTALLSEPDSVEAKSMLDQSEAFLQLEMVRHEAMKQFMDYEFNQALRKAMLRKSRPYRGPLEIGQKVAYFRHRAQLDGEGTAEGYRQGLIIGLDPGPTGSVWLRNHRGRIVQASREQIRSVEGDELWSPNTDDINALKNAEEDLGQRHALAFDHRAPGPTLSQDQSVVDTLDAAGRPQLSAAKEPLVIAVPSPGASDEPTILRQQDERREAAPMTPLTFLPPTPAHAPSTPVPPREQKSLPYPAPSLPALPPIPEDADVDEPNQRASSKATTRTGSKATTASQLKLQDQPAEGSEVRERQPGAIRRPSSSADAEGSSRPAKREARPDPRGVKREATPDPSALREQTQEVVTETAVPSPEVNAQSLVLLLYCKQCGTQDYNKSYTSCPRCSAREFIEDPKQVINWFDEVEEHEALGKAQDFQYDLYYKRWLDRSPQQAGHFDLPQDQQLEEHHEAESFITGVGQVFRQLPETALTEENTLWSVATKAPEGDWQWTHIFETIDIDSEVVQDCMHDIHRHPNTAQRAFIKHGGGGKRRIRDTRKQPESRFLRRHGRHCNHVSGWDGTPPQLQPAFEANHFMQAYHTICEDVAEGRYVPPEEYQQEWQADADKVKTYGIHFVTKQHAMQEQSVFNTHTDQVFRREDSSDEEEGCDSQEVAGRAAKQALKREVPWRSISSEDWPAFAQSLREEWQEWEKWSSCEAVELQENEVDPRLILKSRVCYRWKPKDGGKWFKAKARIVIQGYRDPHLPLLTRDAPVLAKTSFILILQWAACHRVSVHNGDCKSAFLQGLPDDERPQAIYMRPPQDGISLEVNPVWRLKHHVYRLSAPVYGQANAPRRWYLYVVHVLLGLLWTQHTLDPCCFLYVCDGCVVAVLGLHVDDIITCCLPDYEHVLDKVKESFVWGSEWEKDDFVFVGRRIQRQPDGGFTLDQTHYVADIMLTKITKDPSEKLENYPELVTEFRSGIGSLQWLAGTTRGDLSAYVSLLQKRHSELTVADLIELNRVLKYVRATATATVRIYPFDIDSLVFVAYGDSGFGNAPGGKSQGGYVVLVTDKEVLNGEREASLVDWKSYRHQRALRSTLAAEAAALDRAQDTASFMACVFTEMVNGNYKATSGIPGFEVIPITDARSLWDAVHRLSTTFAEKRVEIDVAGLRESCKNLRWVPTEMQHADALTKMNSKLRDQFRKWMSAPKVTLVESKSASDVLRMFSDELFDQMRAAYRPDDMTGAGGLNSDDDDVAGDEGMLAAEEETVTHDGSVDPGPDEDPPVVDVLQPGASRDGSMTSSRRRRRGTRGSGASSGRSLGSQNVAIRKWRSGAIPTAPTFEGDIDANPFCLRHYRRRLMRWVRITKEYLPANEQALRAREQLQGEAEIELEETPDEKYDCEEGISLLLADLEQSFGERELFRQGGVIREFESIGRLQGETVTSFVRRFRLLEGRLKDNKVPSYPEEARVVKLLDGLRLDERSTSALLLAAGNRYNMQAIQEAIRIQYPAGMSVTGIPKPAAVNNKKTKSNYSKWSSLHTTGYEDYDEAEYEALAYEYEPGYDEANEYEHADVEPEGDVEYYYDEEDETAVNEQSGTAAEEASSSQPLADSLIQAVNALTVTSRQLAEITKARGFYQLKNDKGKGLKGKSAGKAKGKGKNFGSSKGFGKYSGGKKGKPVANSAAQGKGKPSATPTRQNLDQQRQRLNTAACLGCGSTSHWIKDCPHNNKYSAQLATVGVTLNAEGIPMSECLMVSTEEEKSYQLPELHENNHFDRTSLPLEHIQQNEFHELDLLPDGSCSIPPTPKVLIQYANQEAFLMIADTGCQRQVAGLAWHLQRQKEIYPLQPLHAKEHCRFSFGPNAGVPSKERLAYPAGLGGAYAMLGISLVESNAPALFSRPAFEKLGAIPNLLQGVMHYVALQTCSRLYLSPCGHLAIRIDEWPSRLFAWPPEIEHSSFEDAWSPDALKLETTVLQQPEVSSCPPPHAASNSAMASQVARFDAPCHGVCVLDPTGSDSLRSCEHASQSQGQGSEGVLSGSDGNHNAADDFGTHAAVHHSDSGLCEQTQPVHSPVGPQILRGRQDQGKDMRFVRIEMRDRERRFDTSTTKSISDRKDSSFRDQDQGQEQGNVKFPLRKLGRGLRLLFPTLLAAGICGPSAPVDKPFVNGVQVASSTLDCWHDGGGSGGPSSSLRGPSLSAGSPQSSGAFGHLSGRGRGRHVLGTTSGSGGELRTHGGGRGGTDGWVNDGVHFSADQPMTVDDVGSGPLKAGTEKRLRGNCRQVHDIWQVEAKIYAQQAQRARVMRSYHYDVVEIFGGMSNITVEALQCGLRALQPVDVVHGVKLDDKKDYKVLTKLLKERRPFLVVWEIRCDPWSKLNHLNYTADELQALQDSHYESLAGMCEAIIELYKDGIHFLIENPWGTAFWTHDEIMRVRALPGARLEKGSMCNFGLRGKEGNLIRKDTGWLSDLAEVLHQIARPCSGNHDHEHCLGGNSKRAQVYTKALARGVVKGLIQTLKSCGDERFLSGDEPCRFQWVCANEKGVLFSNMDFDIDSTCWSCTTLSDNFEVLYLDIDRNEQAWLPLLAEAQTRWEDKVSASAIVRPGTAFFAQIQDLVPWVIHQAQIARSPKVRRIPHQLMSSKPVTHRASILKFQDGKVRLETEEVKSFSSSKFEAPVTFAIFVYGEAPETSLDPSANALPETEALNKPDKEKAPSALQPEEELRAHQPGSRDITFEAEDGKIPKWVQNALRRLHTNLGHPSNESLVRHLAQAGASGVALLGGKALRCSVCSRTRPPHQPRPAKAVRSRRFNDRIFLDIVFLKNINFETFAYLNVLDDATTYQVLDALDSRSEECVVKTLVNGWLRYFGYPDEMVVDAEGALRGILFENLVAQTGIQLRFVPPDAHYQLGKCERHGQAAKWIARRLVSQFAAVTQEEMNIMTSLTTWAKNTMIRRCGASPCQWVYGKQPKIPTALLSEPDSVEAKSMLDQSEAFLQLEMVRHEAMKQFMDYEFNQALRKAMLRKSRPYRGPLEIGQKVAYFRHRAQLDGEGTAEGYRQGLIIGLDPGPTGSVWLRNHRGRIVQASREQIRSVEGDELWSPNTDDINALKNAEEDLGQRHALAFDHRAPGPTLSQDQSVVDTLDAAGRPQLSAAKEPLVIAVPSPGASDEPTILRQQDERREAAPMTPLTFLPPTPAHAPSTPVPPREQKSLPYPAPSLPALPPIPEDADVDEPNQRASSKATTRTGSKATTASQLKLQDQPAEGSEVRERQPGAIRRPSSSADAEGSSRPAKREARPDPRGVKREATPDPSALREQTQEVVTETAVPSPEVNAQSLVLLLYCKQCGTQDYNKSYTSCPRCSAREFIEDPKQVINWFDEVEEHEALGKAQDFQYDLYYKRWLDRSPQQAGHFDLPQDQQLEEHHEAESFITGVGQVFRQLPETALTEENTLWSVATKAPEGDWQWTHIFETIDIDSEVVQDCMHDIHRHPNTAQRAFIKHGGGGKRRIRDTRKQPESRFLRRHGRHCNHVSGWDGTPPQLQPAFEANHFMQAYHTICEDVAEGRYVPPEEYQQEWQADADKVKTYGIHFVTKQHAMQEQSVFNTHTDQVFRREDSSDEEEGCDSQEVAGRAAKQALKREVPWRSISSEDWPAFAQSLREEWQEWEKWSSCEAVELQENEVDPRLILKSRVCYRWKPKDGGKWFKAKARIVIQGYRDPHLPLLTRDAPVLAKTSFILILQWAACHRVSVHNGDCKSAFLQGLPDDERPQAIYMRPPQDGISLEVNPVWRLKHHVYRLSAPVYGQANAPRRWYLYVVHVLLGLLWTQHTLDPCCFLYVCDGCVVAVLGLHVDDIITCCLPDYEHVLDKVKESFVWGSEWEKDDFVFVGRRIQRQPDGGFTLDQTHYVADIMLTKITKDPSEKLENYPELVTEFRSGIGSLQWLAGTTRGDLSAYVSLLQKRHSELTVADLIELNRVLKYVRATATATVRIYPFDIDSLVFVAYGDSGFGNAPGGKSQGGYVVLVTDKEVLNGEREASLVDWKSYRHQRALRSTLAAEAAALDRAQDTASFMACVFTEMVNGNYKATSGIPGFEVIPITDARSLWDAVHRLSTTFAEKRVEIDVAGLRESCKNLRWVPTEMQHADALTKMNSKLRDQFRKWMSAPKVTLVESKSASDICGATADACDYATCCIPRRLLRRRNRRERRERNRGGSVLGTLEALGDDNGSNIITEEIMFIHLENFDEDEL